MSVARLVLVSLCCSFAGAQDPLLTYPPDFHDARAEVYKTIGNISLKLYIFNPPESGSSAPRPAIVFFFGGGWRAGSPSQFEGQCRRIASLGMVAITADYRVSSRHHSTVLDSVRDAKSAIRYVRQNASRLGIDPLRIAAGGGSAGGHLAAAAGIVPGLDEPGENTAVSSRPNALVLFNPVVVLGPLKGNEGLISEAAKRVLEGEEFQGVDAMAVSPSHHISKGDPPTIIFHGREDTTVPYASVEEFTRKMQAAGNRCELIGFDGQQHGFFNQRPGGNKYYDETLRDTETFLGSLGYLKSK